MWLVRTDRPPSRHPRGGWKMRMLSAGNPITIQVTDEAVREFAQPNAIGDAFYVNRKLFEEIADRKFASRLFEPDGSIKVEPADIVRQ